MSEGWSRDKAVVLGFRRRVVERGIFSLSLIIHTVKNRFPHARLITCQE